MDRAASDVQVSGVVLAGGRSSRMGGRDKAFAAVDGEPIAVRTIRLFRTLFPQVIVATNRAERYRALDVETVGDQFPGCGPLAGIHAAMSVARHPHVFVAACDMPGLDADVIRFLLGRIGDGDADAVVPRWDDDIEPLHAVYAVRLADRIADALRSGRHAIRDLLPRLRVDYVGEEELARIRGTARSMLNVNTPEELAAVGGSLEDA
jgi:molybdopterin-guanine dinucleotide biosynthesis protein A